MAPLGSVMAENAVLNCILAGTVLEELYPKKDMRHALHPHGPMPISDSSQNKPSRKLKALNPYGDTAQEEIVPSRPLKMRYKPIRHRAAYDTLLKTGMFFEFYPELTGDWHIDRDIIWHNVCTASSHDAENNR